MPRTAKKQEVAKKTTKSKEVVKKTSKGREKAGDGTVVYAVGQTPAARIAGKIGGKAKEPTIEEEDEDDEEVVPVVVTPQKSTKIFYSINKGTLASTCFQSKKAAMTWSESM